jgi:uncharacterized protein YjiS (DUF1127 family)
MLTILISAWRALGGHLVTWRRRQRAYAELAGLDDRSLADIGITRSEIPYVLSQPYEKPAPSARTGVSGSVKHAA